MDLDDMFKSVGGGQLSQVTEVVSFFSEHGDDLLEAVEFIKEHGDDLIDLIRRLPDILGRAGESIVAAGGAATAAGSFLVGDDGNDATGLTEAAGQAIAECTKHLGSVETLLAKVGSELSDISIPSLDVSHTEVLGLSVVSGLDIKQNRVLGGAADQLESSAQALGDVVGALDTVGTGLGQLSTAFDSTGQRLSSVGDDMDSGGRALAELSGKPLPKRPSATRRRAATKKTARKKPAARRKPATKKPAARKKPVSRARSGLGGGVLKKG